MQHQGSADEKLRNRTPPRSDYYVEVIKGGLLVHGGQEPISDSQASRSTGVRLEDVSSSRDGVVRLCARLTGRPDVAEDLAQEALFLAWRHESALRDSDKRQQWILGIARNLCLRWRRAQGRERACVSGADDEQQIIAELPEENADLEVELERNELAALLDRAIGLLPQETRDLLVQSYIEERPHSEIGHRLRLSESAVKARLHRGRIALRQVFSQELRDEAVAYGLGEPTVDTWQETRIWCPQCGERRLMVRFAESPGPIAFRCPACSPEPEHISLEYRLANSHFSRLIGRLRRPKAILNRVYPWAHEYFSRAVEEEGSRCTNCGQPVRLQMLRPEWVPADSDGESRLYLLCEACGEGVSASLGGQVLALPQVQRFWREHPRMRTLPGRLVEAEGRVAVVTTFEAVDGGARLDVLSDRDTFRILEIGGAATKTREGCP